MYHQLSSEMCHMDCQAPCGSCMMVLQHITWSWQVNWFLWNGHGGTTHWLARSPDLNPCDFCIWEYLKTQVYTWTINIIPLTIHSKLCLKNSSKDYTLWVHQAGVNALCLIASTDAKRPSSTLLKKCGFQILGFNLKLIKHAQPYFLVCVYTLSLKHVYARTHTHTQNFSFLPLPLFPFSSHRKFQLYFQASNIPLKIITLWIDFMQQQTCTRYTFPYVLYSW
jgi:hypothetical protein